MIANERQYRITNAAAREFEEALARLETVEADRPPELRQVMREAMESQLDELREEIAEYDALRSGKVGVLELTSLAELPDALIRARIAVGLTQKTARRAARTEGAADPALRGDAVRRREPGPHPGRGRGARGGDPRAGDPPGCQRAMTRAARNAVRVRQISPHGGRRQPTVHARGKHGTQRPMGLRSR